jgi:hypothetical protein
MVVIGSNIVAQCVPRYFQLMDVFELEWATERCRGGLEAASGFAAAPAALLHARQRG